MFQVDKLFVNGKFYTMAAEGQTVSALAVHHGKIVAAGAVRDLGNIPAAEIVDLGGKTVLPGFTDTHCHMAECAEGLAKVDLGAVTCMDEAVELLKAGLRDVRPGKWLTGYQISAPSLRENRLPTRYDLDRVSREVPIFLSSNCLHNFMVNSKALELAGIDRYFDRPERRLLECDESGEPTGRLREHGMLKYVNAVRPCALESGEEGLKALERCLLDFAGSGFTTVHSYDGFDGSKLDDLAPYQELERRGRLPVRVILNRQHGVGNALGAVSGLGNEKIKYGAVKFFTDGSFSQRSAYLRESYADQENFRGIPIYQDAEYLELVKAAYGEGNDIAIHVIGDGGLAQVLDILRRIYDPGRKQQFRLIHGLFAAPDQWEEMVKYPITVDTQPVFLPNMGTIGQVRLEPLRAQYLMPLKSMLECGILVTGGDDAPIGSHHPFVGIRYAVLREIEFGGTVLNPSECLSVYQAVSLYTRNAAFCAHEEHLKGTLEPGKLADFIVLDRDIFTVPPKQISALRVLETYLGGSPVFRQAGNNA